VGSVKVGIVDGAGVNVGLIVGSSVGNAVGLDVGDIDGGAVGLAVGNRDGLGESTSLGFGVLGRSPTVGDIEGSGSKVLFKVSLGNPLVFRVMNMESTTMPIIDRI
jgi:hypothetical protein